MKVNWTDETSQTLNRKGKRKKSKPEVERNEVGKVKKQLKSMSERVEGDEMKMKFDCGRFRKKRKKSQANGKLP